MLQIDDERAVGRAARQAAPRRTLADWTPPPDRPDPVAVLREQDERREAGLVPIRHGRMDAGPFAFYRGGAAIMAADLAGVPTSGLTAQLCGDAHLSNFGVYASPDRRLVFDINDFDETCLGPWEWDLARLAASFEIAGRHRGLPAGQRADAVRAVATTYRDAMAGFAQIGLLDTWYARLEADDIAALAHDRSTTVGRRVEQALGKARSRTSLHALRKLTETVDGRLRFRWDPPLLVPLASVVGDRADEVAEGVRRTYVDYLGTLPDSRRTLLERYRPVDVAHKVVGVGSVGLRAFVMLLEGRHDHDALLLQAKEASASVLEQHLSPSLYTHGGQRVVEGQLSIQSASDIFLGWSSSLDGERHYYWRQLRDMKGGADVDTMRARGLQTFARLCGWTLARSHARTGSPVAIAAYLGKGDSFGRALAEFATRYADQNERDFERHRAAIHDGELEARRDV
ncbi:MAG TPA: DUF2252 domain-containing protein [Acidimicrobiales bacterium]|nr:DUF2252 domain-containing protein [Acidimicrobiales bacterium]